MAKLTRIFQKLFGSSGPSGDFGEFGSLAAGIPNYTKDPTIIQDLDAFLTGWAAATITNNRPALEDMNSLFYLSYYQICYLLQQGVPEWDGETTYYENSIVQVNGVLYVSLEDINLNKNPTTETSWWSLVVHSDLSILEQVYPIGSVYISTVATDPTTLFGFGTWVAFGAGRVLLGDGGGYSAGATGGEATHILTTPEMPAHTHTGDWKGALVGGGSDSPGSNVGHVSNGTTSSTGGDGAHNNLQPYIVVYMWNRTA